MNKDEMLPMAVDFNHISYWGAVAQRDADWERIKPLVEAAMLLCNPGRHIVSVTSALKTALVNLELWK